MAKKALVSSKVSVHDNPLHVLPLKLARDTSAYRMAPSIPLRLHQGPYRLENATMPKWKKRLFHYYSVWGQEVPGLPLP